MEHIRAGDLGAKAEGKTNIREFNEVNETFNTMMTQIKDLKIESYEHEIQSIYLRQTILPCRGLR